MKTDALNEVAEELLRMSDYVAKATAGPDAPTASEAQLVANLRQVLESLAVAVAAASRGDPKGQAAIARLALAGPRPDR